MTQLTICGNAFRQILNDSEPSARVLEGGATLG
jgi:hypothetical protein